MPAQFPNPLKVMAAKNPRLIGFWLTLMSPSATEIAAEAGFDWLLIDMEHAANDVATVMHHLRACGRGHAEPVVRLPSLDAVMVKRLLDAGARSFMFPNVNTVEEAELAVASTRYPPRGIRGVSATTRGAGYGRWPSYFAEAETDICVIVQLESVQAVDSAADIAAVEGVDVLFIGPSDLSAAMGYIGKPKTEAVQAKIAQGLASILASGKLAGTLNFMLDDAEKQLGDGFGLLAVAGDASLLVRQTNEIVARFRQFRKH